MENKSLNPPYIILKDHCNKIRKALEGSLLDKKTVIKDNEIIMTDTLNDQLNTKIFNEISLENPDIVLIYNKDKVYLETSKNIDQTCSNKMMYSSVIKYYTLCLCIFEGKKCDGIIVLINNQECPETSISFEINIEQEILLFSDDISYKFYKSENENFKLLKFKILAIEKKYQVKSFKDIYRINFLNDDRYFLIPFSIIEKNPESYFYLKYKFNNTKTVRVEEYSFDNFKIIEKILVGQEKLQKCIKYEEVINFYGLEVDPVLKVCKEVFITFVDNIKQFYNGGKKIFTAENSDEYIKLKKCFENKLNIIPFQATECWNLDSKKLQLKVLSIMDGIPLYYYLKGSMISKCYEYKLNIIENKIIISRTKYDKSFNSNTGCFKVDHNDDGEYECSFLSDNFININNIKRTVLNSLNVYNKNDYFESFTLLSNPLEIFLCDEITFLKEFRGGLCEKEIIYRKDGWISKKDYPYQKQNFEEDFLKLKENLVEKSRLEKCLSKINKEKIHELLILNEKNFLTTDNYRFLGGYDRRNLLTKYTFGFINLDNI